MFLFSVNLATQLYSVAVYNAAFSGQSAIFRSGISCKIKEIDTIIIIMNYEDVFCGYVSWFSHAESHIAIVAIARMWFYLKVDRY